MAISIRKAIISMNIDRLRDSLEFRDDALPYEALYAAIEQRAEITPFLLDALEQANDLDSQPDHHYLHIYAAYLLAQFREPRALQPLLRLVSDKPDDVLDRMLGDIVTEDLPAILASVCGSDAAPLRTLAWDRDSAIYVRYAALGGLAVLHLEGDLTREELIADLRAFYEGLRPDEAELRALWGLLILDIYPDELLAELKSAFDQDMVDFAFWDWDDVEFTLAAGREHTLAEARERYRYVDDAISRLEKWDDGGEWTDDDDLDELLADVAPYVRPTAKIGRNDPCPCGSGKKYKKCCGAG